MVCKVAWPYGPQAKNVSAAIMHYILVALCILATFVPQAMLESVEAVDPLSSPVRRSQSVMLDLWAMQICGIAFTSKSPTVLVNSFGPMAYCECFTVGCRFLLILF